MRALVIGYGNPSRRDDGVALVVVNALRRRLGLAQLDETVEGYDDLGRPLDTLFLQQLTPELAEIIAGYDSVVFVDAHVGQGEGETVRHTPIDPSFDPALVSHHFRPGRLLAMARALYGSEATAELVSILGFDFDFGPELSPATVAGAAQAVEELWTAYGAGDGAGGS